MQRGRILEYVSPTPLYARVDFVRTGDGDFAVVESELIEPSMYLRNAAHAPEMFARAIDTWLNGAINPATKSRKRSTYDTNALGEVATCVWIEAS